MKIAAEVTRLPSAAGSLPVALGLARQGLAVLPLYPVRKGHCTCPAAANCKAAGKHPLWTAWQQKATSKASIVQRQWPTALGVGIGIHLGKSGLVVLDVDPRNGGDSSLLKLEARLRFSFTSTAQVIAATGGGGQHFYHAVGHGQEDWLQSLKRNLAREYPGLDLLWGDHYCVAAPSVHRCGDTYRWTQEDWEFVTPLPAELLALGDSAVTRQAEGHSSAEAWDVFANVTLQDAETPASVERVLSALAHISADCPRDEWRDVLFALHSTGWDRAEQIAQEWSLTAPHRFDHRSFATVWRSAKDDRAKAVTLGTLFHVAKQNGWVDPRSDAGGGLETYGDISNGRRFADRYRKCLLYCSAVSSWYAWDGMRWVPGADSQALQAAKVVAEEITNETFRALRDDPTEQHKRQNNQALNVHRNIKRLEAMLAAARTEPGMAVDSPSAFDAEPWFLGVRNGIVNLRSGQLLAPDPAQGISKQAGTVFDADATCPRWIAFLEGVFEGDAEMIAFMQRVAGYCLTGHVYEEKLFFLFGHGRNGKSVFCTVLEAALGDYVVSVSSALLTKGSGSEGERYIARLAGARMASANELGASEVWDDERIKTLTSRDRIAARRLYGEAYEFEPTHTLLIRGNHQPGVHDAGEGMWRRMVLVPFKHQFTDAEVIPDLDRQLIGDELPGVLAWAVRGCLDWQEGGLRIPTSIQALTSEYRRDTDLLGMFLSDCTRCDERAETSISLLYVTFERYCKNQGVRPPSRIAFGRQLRSRGFEMRPSSGKRLYRGLALLDEWEDEGECG